MPCTEFHEKLWWPSMRNMKSEVFRESRTKSSGCSWGSTCLDPANSVVQECSSQGRTTGRSKALLLTQTTEWTFANHTLECTEHSTLSSVTWQSRSDVDSTRGAVFYKGRSIDSPKSHEAVCPQPLMVQMPPWEEWGRSQNQHQRHLNGVT